MLFFYILWFKTMTLPGGKKVYFEWPLLFVYPLSLVLLLDCLYVPNNGAYGKNLICIACNVSSGWWLDAVVCVVRLLCELRSGRAGPNPRLHQPPTTQQRVRLQRTSKGNTGVSRCSLPGFVNKCFQESLSPFQYVAGCLCLIGHYWLYRLQTTFALGRPGHRAPVAAAQAPCRGAGRAFARQQATRPVPLRSRPRGTARRLSCVTNSRVQVHRGKQQKNTQLNKWCF